MRQDTPFKICIILSTCIHLAVLHPWPFLRLIPEPDISSQRIELVYLQNNLIEDVIVKDTKPVISVKQKAEKSSSGSAEPYIEKEVAVPKITIFEIAQDPKAEDAGLAESVLDKIAFENYYLEVREKIKSALEKNGKRFDREGEVYLKFTIKRGGELRDLALYKNSTGNIPLLEKIAIKSVKEASPFPPFDEEITKAELPFKLPIRFILHPHN